MKLLCVIVLSETFVCYQMVTSFDYALSYFEIQYQIVTIMLTECLNCSLIPRKEDNTYGNRNHISRAAHWRN